MTQAEANQKKDVMDQITQTIEKNSKFILIGFVALVLGLGAYWAFSLVQSNKVKSIAKKAGIIHRRLDLLEQALAKTATSDEVQSNLDKEMGSIGKDVEALVASEPGQAITDLTSVRWATFLMNQKRSDQALAFLNKVQPSKEHEISATNLFAKAKILSESSKLGEALKVYDEVLSNKNWTVFHGEAMIQKAILLQAQGQNQEAQALLQTVKEKHRNTAFEEDAAKYLRFLKLKPASANTSNEEG